MQVPKDRADQAGKQVTHWLEMFARNTREVSELFFYARIPTFLWDPQEVRYASMIQSSHSVEVRIKGRWVSVPVMRVNGHDLTATGKWVRIARVRGEEMMEKELEAPELYRAALKNDTNHILKSDIF